MRDGGSLIPVLFWTCVAGEKHMGIKQISAETRNQMLVFSKNIGDAMKHYSDAIK